MLPRSLSYTLFFLCEGVVLAAFVLHFVQRAISFEAFLAMLLIGSASSVFFLVQARRQK